MADATNKVALVSKTQSHMADCAALPRTLMGGTKGMRKAGENYLPKEPAETPEGYKNRLSRSTLFNAFGKTVVDMTGKVFTKPVVLKDNVPAEVKVFAEDIDLTGRHLNVFARDTFLDGMVSGGGYILTDMPKGVVRADGQPATLQDEQEAGIRPYLVFIPVERLIGWKSTMVAGAETLTQIRIKEIVTEPDGDYAEKEVDQIRVINAGVNGAGATWEVFRRSTADAELWTSFDKGSYKLPNITLAAFYTNRTGFMTFEPPLSNLADVNVAHWQSQSDQRNILHVARVPILFGAGFSETDTLKVGASEMVKSSDANAKLTYVEHTGKAIEAGDKDLQNLEAQMAAMGLQLLIDKPGGQSATGEVRDDAKEHSPLAMMARSLGDAIEESLGYMAAYLQLGTDKGGEVEVNTTFGVGGIPGDLQYLTQAVIAGKIDMRTYLESLIARGVLPETTDVEVVMSRLESAKPELNGNPMDLSAGPKPNGNNPPA